MNERHARNMLSEIGRIRDALDAISKIGLGVSDTTEQHAIWRLTGAAAESMRELEELVARQHPSLAPQAYIPPTPAEADAMHPLDIRQLGAADLGAYRELHRFALTESPHAFVETSADDAARPDSDVAAMLARGGAWGLFEERRLLGKLVLTAPSHAALSHTRWLHAVYLHPDARGRGAGWRLLDAAVAHARAEDASLVALWVNAHNIAARSLYERCGFRATGRAPGGVRLEGAYVDDILMCRDLRRGWGA